MPCRPPSTRARRPPDRFDPTAHTHAQPNDFLHFVHFVQTMRLHTLAQAAGVS